MLSPPPPWSSLHAKCIAVDGARAFVSSPSPCSTTPRRDNYQRRRPDETRLYQVIEEHWPAFLERAEQAGGLPDFIVEEFEAYERFGRVVERHGRSLDGEG